VHQLAQTEITAGPAIDLIEISSSLSRHSRSIPSLIEEIVFIEEHGASESTGVALLSLCAEQDVISRSKTTSHILI
jgi:hypothetical protein